MMPEVVFGEWTPDRAAVDTPGLQELVNMIRTLDGYSSFSDLSASNYSALPAECRGAASLRTSLGSDFILAGTVDELYVYSSETGVDKTGVLTPNLDTTKRWTFDVFGANLFAVYARPGTLYYSDGTANFAEVSAEASEAGAMAVHGDFLILGDIKGRGTHAASIGTQEAGLHWCAIGNPLSWPDVTTAAAADAQSGTLILEGDGGKITDIVSTRDFALVLRDRQVWRLDYVGPPTVWSARKIDESRGSFVPGSAISVGGIVYYIAEDGFRICDGSSIQSIGFEKVDATFLSLLNKAPEGLARVSVAHAPSLKSVIWSVPSGASTPNYQWAYHYELGQWWNFQKGLEWLLTVPSLSGSLDAAPYATQDMDVDAIASLNLDTLIGSDQRTLAAFGTDHKLQFFDFASYLSGRIETSDFKSGAERAMIRSLRPEFQGTGMVTGGVAARLKVYDPQVFESRALKDTGRIPIRKKGRYLAARFDTTGQIFQFQGFDPFYGLAGRR